MKEKKPKENIVLRKNKNKKTINNLIQKMGLFNFMFVY